MATKQTKLFKGATRPVQSNQFRAGSPIVFRHTHIFAETVASTDILELFQLPPGALISRLRSITANVGAINLTIAQMTGTPGDAVTARTLGTSIVTGVAANTEIVATFANMVAGGVVGSDPVSIGLTPAADITSAANKTITIEVEFFIN